MSRAGEGGKGESVWLGLRLVVLFAPLTWQAARTFAMNIRARV